MLFRIKSFLIFLIKSTNQHGVHSPFIYNLITKCFYAKTNPDKIEKVLSYRNELLHNHSEILITGFGKSSKSSKTTTRKISKIAKVDGISTHRSKLLIRLSEYISPYQVLELGTSLGVGTAAMAIGQPKSQITSLENCIEKAKIAQAQFDNYHFNNIRLIIGKFDSAFSKIQKKNLYDLIYFNGNHEKEATILHFETCLNYIHNDSVIIFDNIHWSKEMEETWKIIKESSKVTVSIDTFYWGFVFFRKEQSKEHFIIRV